MVPSLRSLSIKASIQDLPNLKLYINIVPRAILYDLVQYCFSAEPKKTLAFQTLFQNWPFDTFSLQSIGVTLAADDILLMLFAVQKCQFGSIKHLDLVQKEFSDIEPRITRQYIKLLLHNSPLLSTDCYGYEKQVSLSYWNAVKYAKTIVKEERSNTPFSYHNRPKYTVAKRRSNVILSNCDEDSIADKKRKSTDDCCHEVIVIDDDDEDNEDATKLKKEITIYADLYVDADEWEIVNILADEVYERNNVLIKVIPVRIKIECLHSSKILYVLNRISNTGNLRCLDLSFNSLKVCEDSERLSLITESISKFTNLENVCLAYNGLGASECKLFTSCLKQLPKLKRLDLSCNSFGKSLCDLFNANLSSKCLTELKLTDCNIEKSVLNSMAECKWLTNLQKLSLNQNRLIRHYKAALKNVVNHIKATLIHLDVSNCGLDVEDISDIPSIIENKDFLLHL